MKISDISVLNNGIGIPKLGLGTYRMKAGNEAYEAVSYALEIGYRHIDTASIYANEKEVGLAVRDSGIAREEIFITSKLWNSDQGYESAIRAYHESLDRLGLNYLDLYMIHWPVPVKRMESYKALEELYRNGLVRSVGVSNYTIRHLEELLDSSGLIPVVNQVEFSPFLFQKKLLKYCNSQEILIEAYSPLVRGKRMHEPSLLEIARKYSKTPAQVLIRWALQHDLVVLPKSSNRTRIQENADIFDFEINLKDMQKLDSMNEDFRVAWDPETIE